MFALFFSLYYSMFVGSWVNFNINEVAVLTKGGFNSLGKFVTSIFNNVSTPMNDLGTDLFTPVGSVNAYQWTSLVAFVLALITSIGIVVMAVKGIKRVFGVFFMGIR